MRSPRLPDLGRDRGFGSNLPLTVPLDLPVGRVADLPRAPNAEITHARSDRSRKVTQGSRKYVPSTANERATAGVADVRVMVGSRMFGQVPRPFGVTAWS